MTWTAAEIPHAFVSTEHLLLGLIEEGGNLALKVIASLDVGPDDLRRELLGSMAPPAAAAPHRAPFAPLAKEALEATAKEALGLGHNYIGCEHVLLGLLSTEEGLASQVLRRLGLELRTTRRSVVTSLAGFVHAHQNQAGGPPPAPSDLHGDSIREVLRRLDAIEKRLAG